MKTGALKLNCGEAKSMINKALVENKIKSMVFLTRLDSRALVANLK